MNTSHIDALRALQQLPAFDLSYWVIQTIAMAVTALLIPNLRITSIFGPILAVAALSAINFSVWSSDLFSALPNTLSTQALTLFTVNGAIFWIVVKIIPGIESKGFLPVLLAPIVFTTCSVFLPQVITQVNWQAVRTEAQKVVGETKRFVSSEATDSERGR
jgi:putative membrane protein